MRSALRQARSIAKYEAHLSQFGIPTFLCPALLRSPLQHPATSANPLPSARCFATGRRCRQEAIAIQRQTDSSNLSNASPAISSTEVTSSTLPRNCPGCGAPSQIYDKKEAGYYDIDRKSVKRYLRYDPQEKEEARNEDEVYLQALRQADPSLVEELGGALNLAEKGEEGDTAPETPVCDRCHNLIHHRIGTPIHHPSVESIKQTIDESPHRRNHIYHVVDAADFPLSLVPNLQSSLRLPKLRTHNRRAKHKGWVGENRIAEISFIITRADLLAPLKEQVDKLLPYTQDVLRNALGRVNSNARLGNVHLVSAKRGWWTKRVKEDIWDRGGAGWMVGKVNVGKSNLFEVVFPKGRGADYQELRRFRTIAEREEMVKNAVTPEQYQKVQKELAEEDAELERRRRQPVLEPDDMLPEENEEDMDPDSLLPARQPYTPYPVLPVASSLPGTTASPIRIPFGRNRGELIDLPGLPRTSPDLTTFVQPDHHDELVMTNRISPERYVLKPGQSLLLGGGLVRITPRTRDLTFLLHPFVPLAPHITATDKAIALQNQTSDRHVPSILLPNVGDKMKSAGIFPLQWDVTKQLAGPLTSSVAGKMKAENLPFRIMSTDILVEGVGWIEVSAQTRKPRGWKPVGLVKKDPNHARYEKERRQEGERRRRDLKYGRAEVEGDAFDRAGLYREGRGREELEDEDYPEIEVFTPLGKYVGARQPMCGSVLGGPKPLSSRERKARPRRSMVSVKRQRKPQGGGES